MKPAKTMTAATASQEGAIRRNFLQFLNHAPAAAGSGRTSRAILFCFSTTGSPSASAARNRSGRAATDSFDRTATRRNPAADREPGRAERLRPPVLHPGEQAGEAGSSREQVLQPRTRCDDVDLDRMDGEEKGCRAGDAASGPRRAESCVPGENGPRVEQQVDDLERQRRGSSRQRDEPVGDCRRRTIEAGGR